MTQLKIKTADESLVPGKEEAQREKRKKTAADEKQANSLFAAPGKKEADLGPDYGNQRIRLHKKDEINPYADAEDARHAMDPRFRTLIILGVVFVVVSLVAAVTPTAVFSFNRYDHTIGGLMSEVAASFQGLIAALMGKSTMYTDHLFTIVATIIAGAAMGTSGGVYQGALKNALASPSTLGVTSGGTLGIIIFAIFVYPDTVHNYTGTMSGYTDLINQLDAYHYFMQYFGTFICSFIGCIVIVLIIMLMATIAGRGHLSNASLIIAGQVFTAVIGVVITWVRLYLTKYGTEDQITLLTQAQSVSFSGTYTLPVILAFGIPVLIILIIIFAMSGRLTLLAFKDEEAQSMGISTKATRNLMVVLCTLMTALVISFCGPVGFVGFMVPHIARNLIGPDFRFLLPACALIGSMLVSVVYVLTELSIPGLASGSTGTITSIAGCIMFLIMALRQRGSSNGQWF